MNDQTDRQPDGRRRSSPNPPWAAKIGTHCDETLKTILIKWWANLCVAI